MKKGTFRLWLRTDKKQKNGAQPLHLIYSLAGKRQYFNTGVVIFEEQFRNGEIIPLPNKVAKEKYKLAPYEIPTAKEAKQDNEAITNLVSTLKRFAQKLELNNNTLTSEDVKREYDKFINPEKYENKQDVLTFGDYLKKYINECELIKSAGTIKEYRTVERRINEYNGNINIADVDYNYLKGFNDFLIKNNVGNITAAKQISTAKTFLNEAEKKGIKVNGLYKAFTVERETDLEVVALTEKEFELLFNLELKNARLKAIRDVFVFSCATGMRYSDLAQLRWHQIKDNKIQITVMKTGRPLKIPLNKYSRAILERYKDQPRPLPIISNQKSNDALHELCEKAGINEQIEIVRYKGTERIVDVLPKHQLITMHAGRKTFCTLSLAKGMNAQEVMAISGHKDYRSFKRYVNITDDQATGSMGKAWD